MRPLRRAGDNSAPRIRQSNAAQRTSRTTLPCVSLRHNDSNASFHLMSYGILPTVKQPGNTPPICGPQGICFALCLCRSRRKGVDAHLEDGKRS